MIVMLRVTSKSTHSAAAAAVNLLIIMTSVLLRIGHGSNCSGTSDVPRTGSGRRWSSPSTPRRRPVLPGGGQLVAVGTRRRPDQLLHRPAGAVRRQPGGCLLGHRRADGDAPSCPVRVVGTPGRPPRGSLLDPSLRVLDARRAPLAENLRRD